MLSLREYQQQMAASLLPILSSTNDAAPSNDQLSLSGLHIHQETILSALTKALRYSFPSVLKLLGVDEFRRVAAAYALRHPPEVAILSTYGASFPAYLRASGIRDRSALLFDVARFDLLIEEVANEPLGLFGEPIVLTRDTSLRLDLSLRCRRFHYPVDEIRDGCAADIPGFLRADEQHVGRNLAFWRCPEGAAVKLLSDPAAQFLQALIVGNAPEQAIVSAVRDLNPGEVIRTVQREVFSSSFCLITSPLKGGNTA
jgi:Putative DNA-binding domain